MAWTERPEAVGSTELAVPEELFPNGLQVVLDGKAVTAAWDRTRSVLRLDPDRKRADHTVCVQPEGANACSA